MTPEGAPSIPVHAGDRGNSTRPAALLWTAVGLLVAFAAMGAVVLAAPLAPLTQPLDDWWRSVVGQAPESSVHLSLVPMIFQYLGEAPGLLVLIVLVPLGLAVVGRWRSALFVASAGLVTVGLLSQTMKNLVDRPRPAADAALGLYGPLFSVDHGSYPSGHAVAVGCVVVVVAALIPPSRATARTIGSVVGAFLIAGMVWQRTLINAHWLSDTVFGAVAGVGGALLMWWLFWPWLNQDYGRPLALFGRIARRSGSVAPAAL